MVLIQKTPDVTEKLAILSQDSQYDLACACGTRRPEEHRRRSKDGKWIYPVVLPNGHRMFLLKTLVSNVCANDCKYCPLRANQDPRRCTLTPEETVEVFLAYYRARKVSGLFLSSGVVGTPDRTMDRINTIAAALRRREFKGYIHLKIIPGASDAAVEQAVALASAVSLNIETAGARHFRQLCTTKNYEEDIIRPIKRIHNLTAPGARYERVKQTTQFVVGASDETDREIVQYAWGLYKRLNLSRVYFSAYQQGLGESDLPGERSGVANAEILTREHRLYQVDWLIRKYRFNETEIPFESGGNLSLREDPKEIWARSHPEFFPVDVNRAGYYDLLRVPGLGPTTVQSILDRRKAGVRIRSMEDLGPRTRRLAKAEGYLKFGYGPRSLLELMEQ